jgi:hypothetical protein
MGHPLLDAQTEALVQEVMRKYGCGRDEAILAVALEHGEVYGDGDLVCLHPLTPEQRRAIGLDYDLGQVIAANRVRLAEEASSEEPDAPEGVAAPKTSSDVRRP